MRILNTLLKYLVQEFLNPDCILTKARYNLLFMRLHNVAKNGTLCHNRNSVSYTWYLNLMIILDNNFQYLLCLAMRLLLPTGKSES